MLPKFDFCVSLSCRISARDVLSLSRKLLPRFDPALLIRAGPDFSSGRRCHRGRKQNGGKGERSARCSDAGAGLQLILMMPVLVAKCIMTDRVAQAAPMLFPMYTVAADVLLKMTKVEPHEDLKAGAKLGVES